MDKTAEQMFEELNFRQTTNDDVILIYEKLHGLHHYEDIMFYKLTRTYVCVNSYEDEYGDMVYDYHYVTPVEHHAITQQLKEIAEEFKEQNTEGEEK